MDVRTKTMSKGVSSKIKDHQLWTLKYISMIQFKGWYNIMVILDVTHL